MRKGIRTLIIGSTLGLASQATGTVGSGDGSHFLESDSCRSHLHALVAHLEETAKLEGRTLVIKWQRDGSVIVSCPDFSQCLWCQDGELHIEFDDPEPEGPGN